MKPNFQLLKEVYPLRSALLREPLYESLGWSDLIKHPAYEDTCAIRMSVALAGARVAIPGSLTIKSGPFKGKSVEPGQRRLSNVLKQMWGQPVVYERGSSQNGDWEQVWRNLILQGKWYGTRSH